MAEYKITEWNDDAVLTIATEANIEAMDKAALLVETSVKKSFPKQGSGRTIRGLWRPGASVKKTKAGKRHMASEPGTPPAIDTGLLRSSIYRVVDVNVLSVEGHVCSPQKYGLWLELGTSKMLPRPFLRPGVHNNVKKINQIFRDANK